MIKLRFFNQHNNPPPFLSIRPLFSPVGSEKNRFVGDEIRMQTWRWTELVLEVTTVGTHSHVDSQALDEVRQRLVDVFLWQLLPDGLQGDFQLISRLRLQREFIVLFQHGVPDVTVKGVKSGETEGHSSFSFFPEQFA